MVEERVSELKVSREEFEKLKIAVEKNTEAIEKLSSAINELAEAQKRTEERINELAEAQKRTEERINELAEAQKRTEERINELAEAQKRTDQNVATLAKRMESLAVEVGRLSETIGFSLEDLGRELLPSRLRELGVAIEGLERRHFVVDGEEIEVNLYGEGLCSGRRILVLGEAKSRIYSNDVERFNTQA
ncbi:hypothetical protein KEJ49_06270, partial [Candidatus Bathyarchaeota archaeon]|nr:hypothetical protein [Candidatus Bathyarchaeota archaeon]